MWAKSAAQQYLRLEHKGLRCLVSKFDKKSQKEVSQIATYKLLIETGVTKHKHWADSSGIEHNVIYYQATFSEAVTTFEHPQHGILYQFEVIIVYKDGSFINGFGYARVYSIQALFRREIQFLPLPI